MNAPANEHEVDAYYSNLPGPEQRRTLTCSCGFTCWGITWEIAGKYLDAHLAAPA